MERTVADAALMLNAIAEPDARGLECLALCRDRLSRAPRRRDRRRAHPRRGRARIATAWRSRVYAASGEPSSDARPGSR